MNAIKSVALSLCAVLVATSGVTLLLPDVKFKKLISYVLSLVVVLTVIGAVRGVELDISVPVTAKDTRSLEDMTARQAEYILKAYLEENGITAKEVLCNMDILESGDIVINKACVYTNANPQSVVGLLKEGFGIKEVEIYAE